MKTTNRPWKVTDDGVGIFTATNECIADIPYYKEDDVQAKANAAFIVKAVNSHDALVECVKRFERYLSDNGGDASYHDADGYGRLTMARAALRGGE